MRPLPWLLSCACVAALAQTPDAEKLADSDVIPAYKVEPAYTPEARAAKLQGSVYLYAEVTFQGALEKIRVMHPLGLGLDEQAVKAVRQWCYKSGRRDVVAQAIEVAFRLDDGGPWRVRQAAYTVLKNPRLAEARTKPSISRYASPDPKACPAEGDSVVVDLSIGDDGRPRSIKPQYPGEPMSDAAAKAIASWQFKPATGGGEPREAIARIEFECGPPHVADPGAPAHPSGSGNVWAPEAIFQPQPEYPAEAGGYLGNVEMKTVIDATGHPTRLRIPRMTGMGLDEPALEAVSQWRYRPGTKDGKPVSVPMTVGIAFRPH